MTAQKLLVLFMVMVFSWASDVQAGEYLNKKLPSWVQIDLQLRHRYEWKSNFDFNKSIDDVDGYHLWRTRLGLTLKPIKELKLFYQLQDSRVSHDNMSGSKATVEDWVETRQLYAEMASGKFSIQRLGLTSSGFRFGRQELSYGAQRLVGGVNWSNVGQTFDAGKLFFKFDTAKLNVDVFGGGKTQIKSPREQNDFFDGSSNDRLGGYYVTYGGLKDMTLEQYVLNRTTDHKTISFGQTGDGDVDDYTMGARIKGKVQGTAIDYEAEGAKQIGDSGSLDVDAQMFVGLVGYTFKHAWNPRLGFEFDYASGDGKTSDRKRTTFDNLFPTNHMFYGYMDFVSLQNINNYRLQVNAFPTRKLELEGNLHFVFLDTPKDNLYGANQSIKRAKRPGAGRHVGNELDLLAKYKLCDYADFWAGYSHLFTGEFLKDTGSANDADFVYLQTTLNF